MVITELGGTIGDIEGQAFVEAIRQFRNEKGRDDCCLIHVSLVPYIAAAHELKSKPTQHSVRELRSMGIQPDFIVCRSDHEVDASLRAKIASFCDVPADHVFENTDLPSIYDVPAHLAHQGFDLKVCERLGLEPRECPHGGLVRVHERDARRQRARGRHAHPRGGQVHPAAGRLPLPS